MRLSEKDAHRTLVACKMRDLAQMQVGAAQAILEARQEGLGLVLTLLGEKYGADLSNATIAPDGTVTGEIMALPEAPPEVPLPAPEGSG